MAQPGLPARDTLAVHFTWVDDAAAVLPVVAASRQRLAPFDPGRTGARSSTSTRPWSPPPSRGYADFAALLTELDPAGVFRTDLLDHYFPRA